MASGDILFKKILLSLVCLCLLSSLFIVNAEETATATVEPYGEFYSLQNDQNKVAEILGIDKKDLNNINDVYLAVNSGNTKQIRIRTEITEFSNRIGNISNLSDDNITALISDIVGVEDVNGDIIDKDGQKFIKIQLRTTDSGGEYILTQYFTVASKQSFVLSFYTDINEDTVLGFVPFKKNCIIILIIIDITRVGIVGLNPQLVIIININNKIKLFSLFIMSPLLLLIQL